MEVYFGKNFWGKHRRGTPGKRKSIEKNFIFNGRSWRIPAVYVCEEGIVADFCVEVPLQEAKDYQKKWASRCQADMESEEELERVERDNPFYLRVEMSAVINGKSSGRCQGCGTVWNPLVEEEERAALEAGQEEDSDQPPEELLMEEYGCRRDCGWVFLRKAFSWPEGEGGSLDFLTFQLKKEPFFWPGPHFEAGLEEKPENVTWTHPRTGVRHTLRVLDCEQEELNCEFPNRIRGGMEWPGHYLRLTYQVEPPVEPGELQVLDCQRSDQPVRMQGESGVAAISIIGGADGPTSIFIAGKKEKEPQVLSAFSSMHFTAVEKTRWRIRFQLKDEAVQEIVALEKKSGVPEALMEKK